MYSMPHIHFEGNISYSCPVIFCENSTWASNFSGKSNTFARAGFFFLAPAQYRKCKNALETKLHASFTSRLRPQILT